MLSSVRLSNIDAVFSIDMETFTCSKCAKNFSYKKNLIRHEKKDSCIQTNGKIKNKTLIKCPNPECQLIFASRDLLLNHSKDVHGINDEVDKLIFFSYNDFQRWKTQIEKETSSYYCQRSTRTIRGVKRIYLDCHRSGYFNSKSRNIRKLKSQGSNKINSICPSFMRVIQYADKIVEVKFHKTHVGHGPSENINLNVNLIPIEEALEVVESQDDEDDLDLQKRTIIQKIETVLDFLANDTFTSEEYSSVHVKVDSLLMDVDKQRKK